MAHIRKETIGDAVLYQGDCMEIMPTLGPVNLLATDFPYKLTAGGNSTGEMAGKFDRSTYANDGNIVKCEVTWDDFMALVFQVLSDPAHAYVMSNNRHVQNMLNAADAAGFGFHNLLVWDKGTATPNRWYMKNLEFTGFFYKGKAFYINDCGDKQLHRVPNILNAPHPTQKPVELFKAYIRNSSKQGSMVLDPFMGAGTTGIAALALGRKFIGIEENADYFDLACTMMEQAAFKTAPELFNDQDLIGGTV